MAAIRFQTTRHELIIDVFVNKRAAWTCANLALVEGQTENRPSMALSGMRHLRSIIYFEENIRLTCANSNVHGMMLALHSA